MSDSIVAFFEAWAMADASSRMEKITNAVSPDIQYDDPRTQGTITGIDAVNNYVGMFSASAPGWSATVVASDTTGGVTRITVNFSGPGPDGDVTTQYGQYFVEKEGDLVSRMVGFVGIGRTE